MNLLRLDGVGRHFGHREVLRNLDLSLEAGQRMAVIGPNGSGKTTLLRIIAGVLRPTAGDMRRPRTAYVAQDAPIYPELTPAEHLAWWTRLHGTEATQGALTQAGLAELAHEPASHLSRGQRQRLALLLALHAGAELLVLDEPYTALDESGAAWLDAALADRTVIFSAHDDAPTRLGARVLDLEAA